MTDPTITVAVPRVLTEEQVRRTVASLEAAALAIQQRIATCHERQPCSACHAPVGKRCRARPRGYRPLDVEGQFRECKTPHKHRLRADGIVLR